MRTDLMPSTIPPPTPSIEGSRGRTSPMRVDHLPPDAPPPDEDPPPGHDRPDDEGPVHPKPDEIRCIRPGPGMSAGARQ